ncbi:MAG: energy transducer TonB [bacterium]|jgi:TonB family protein
MPESNIAPVRFPACALNLRYQHNLLLGMLCASLTMITPALYLQLSRYAEIVHRCAPASETWSSRLEPPGVKGSGKMPLPDKSGLVPILGPEIDQYLEDSGYLGYFDDSKPLPVESAEFALVENGRNWRHSIDTSIYTFNAPLERLPELVWMKDPQYPELARRIGTEGEVILHILVGTDGRAEEIKIVSEKPAKVGFGERAYAAVLTAHFQPALNDHYPVKCWVRLPVVFKLN